MSSVACRVCLRTNVPTLDVPIHLKTFCDELCDFESVQHKRLKYCALCAYQMKKCYQFKGQCLRANGLLKLWIKDENKDISEYHKELPSPSLQFTDNSNSFLFEYDHDEKTLHNTNVILDCNRNLILKMNRSALAPDDRAHPESSEPSLKSNPSIPDQPKSDLRPAVSLSSGLSPPFRQNCSLTPSFRLNSGIQNGLKSIIETEHFKAKNGMLTIDPNLQSRPASRPNPSLRPALKPNPGRGLSIQLVNTVHKQPKQTDLTFDPDFDVYYETDPLALVKDEIVMDTIDENTIESVENTIESVENTIESVENTIESVENTIESVENTIESVENTIESVETTIDNVGNTMDIVENTMDVIKEERVEEFVKQEDMDDNMINIDDAIASVLKIEQKEVDNNECTIGSNKPEEELSDNDSMDNTRDNKEDLINNHNDTDNDIDSDEYTYEYLEKDVDLLDFVTKRKQKKTSEATSTEKMQTDRKAKEDFTNKNLEQDIDLLDFVTKLKQKKPSEATSIEKKQAENTTVNVPLIVILKTEDFINKNVLQPVPNETNIPLEAKVKLNLEHTYSLSSSKVPTFKENMFRLLDESPFVLEDKTVLTKELFCVIYDNLNVQEMKRLEIIIQQDDFRAKLTAYLGVLYRKYNPEYESIFHVEYLHTEEQKIEDFKRRELHPDYIRAAYKCELCYKTYSKQSFLDHHKEMYHNPASPLVCSICSYRMLTKNSLINHRLAVHQAAYSCKLCPLRTTLVAVMRNHYYTHKGVEYHCPVCSKVCYTAHTLLNHKRRAHAKLVCTTCAQQYITEKGLRTHRETQHKDAPPVEPAQTVPCAACDITFDTRQSYLRHCIIGHSPLPDQSLPRRKRVKPPPSAPTTAKFKKKQEQMEKQTKKKKKRNKKVYRTCEICHEKVYVEKFGALLYKHFLEKHPGVPYHAKDMKAKDFLCDECGKAFHCKSILREHKNFHTGVRPYMCDLCPARFHTKKRLCSHLGQTHCDRSYRCEECGKLFKLATHLRAHMRIHIGDRRFKCHICDKGFLHNSALTEHVTGVHYEERRVKKPKKPAQELH